MQPTTLHEKIAELNSRLLDLAEWTGVHMLVNITIVEGDTYKRTMGLSSGFPSEKIMLAALGQSENVYSSLTNQ